jgi:hypothetical protein
MATTLAENKTCLCHKKNDRPFFLLVIMLLLLLVKNGDEGKDADAVMVSACFVMI